MNPIDFGYSMKNIPPPSKETYIYKVIDKNENVLKGMRWKAFFHDSEYGIVLVIKEFRVRFLVRALVLR